jgi:hypothetical protein
MVSMQTIYNAKLKEILEDTFPVDRRGINSTEVYSKLVISKDQYNECQEIMFLKMKALKFLTDMLNYEGMAPLLSVYFTNYKIYNKSKSYHLDCDMLNQLIDMLNNEPKKVKQNAAKFVSDVTILNELQLIMTHFTIN